MSKPPKGIDLERFALAGHELGHYWAAKHGGLTILEVTITGTGIEASGCTNVDFDESREDLMRGYLVTLLAGREGEKRLRQQYGMPPAPTYRYATDLREFRKYRRKVVGLQEGKAIRLASDIVGDHWREIKKTAPEFAKTGRLTRL